MTSLNPQIIHLNDGKQKSDLNSDETPNLTDLDLSPRNLIKNFQIPNILFIVDQFDALDANYDQPFYDYMTSVLGFNVDLDSDDNSYNYANYDAIVISQSTADNTTISLSNITIPILTMNSFNYNHFRLANGRGFRNGQTDIELINTTSHYILEGLPSPIVTIYNSSLALNYIKDYSIPRIDEITSLASPISLQTQRRTLVALEKGKLDWFGIPAYERRVMWTGGEGSYLTSDGWKIFNQSLHWILYDDTEGLAHIEVSVEDLNGQPLANAQVNLTNLNTSQIWLNSSILGKTIFSNVPYGIYNISVDFQGIINSSLSNLAIFGSKTYELQSNFQFSVIMDYYEDKIPPTIQDIEFNNQTKIFSAHILDLNIILLVSLNITIVNETTQLIIRDQTYQMVTTNGSYFFNDTALSGISGTDISMNFNITAVDVAGNLAYSPNQSINLADTESPIIHEYNATNYGNGTVLFYANVTDLQSTVHEVILKINSTEYNMQLNSSGYWVYSTEFSLTELLNYTIYSTTDTIGNQGGLVAGSLFPLPDSGTIFLSDTQAPHIYGVTDTFNSHENGYVEIIAFIDDWNEFQSGVDTGQVFITLFINNENTTVPMNQIGSVVFAYDNQFNYSDTVSYIISAYDFAGNLAFGDYHGNFSIDDIIKPIVNYFTQDFGNGTVEFSSFITDWPNNQTSAYLLYTQNFFGSWINLSMANINDTYYSITALDLNFQVPDVWYYIIASDSNGNSYIPTSDQYLRLTLVDMVAPVVKFTIENSTVNDGQITIRAFANDPYGSSNFLNNSFLIKFITSQGTTQLPMVYESFFTYRYTQSFLFGETVTIEVSTQDDAGNVGFSSKTIVIFDKAAPKINDLGVINHQDGSITIWAEVTESPLGSGLLDDNSSVTLEYIFKIPFSKTMAWNGTGNYYSLTISGFEPGDAIPYNIKAIDKAGNVNSTPSFSDPYLLYIKPEIDGFGVEYLSDVDHIGEIHVWVEIDYPFNVKPDLFVTLIDQSSGYSWVNQSMRYNGTHFVYDHTIPYQHNFSYSISLIDIGTIRGEYSLDALFGTTHQMPDIWAPVIHDTGAIQLDDSNILVWANVTDYGSNVSQVAVLYDFEYASSGNRLLIGDLNLMNAPMTYNGSLYVVTISSSGSGKFKWGIMAMDNAESIIETSLNNQLLFISIQPSNGLDSIYLFIIIGIVTLLCVFIIIRIIFTRRKKKRLYLLKCEQKLDDLEKIYMINVQNSDGLPIVVQKSSVNPHFNVDATMLAGYVSATSSVRDELITQMDAQEVFQDDSNVISKIEQSSDGKLNIITTLSDDIIFLTYTSGIARKWWQELQVEAHKSLKESIKPMIGRVLVDESIRLPAIEAISKHIPLVLLELFTLVPDVFKKKDKYEIILKKAVLVSSPVSHKVPKMSDKKIKKEYEKFLNNLERTPDFTIQTLRTILVNVLNLPPDEVFDIIWDSAMNGVFKKVND